MKEGFVFHWHFLITSLKKLGHKQVWLAGFYELAFWILFLVLGNVLSTYLSKSFAGFYQNAASPTQLANLQGPLTDLQSKLFLLIGLVLVYLLLLFVLWTLSRSLIWATLLSKPWSIKFGAKMLLAQLIWGLLFVLPWFIIFRIVTLLYGTAPFVTSASVLYYIYLTLIVLVLIAFVLVYHHFTITMYLLFTRHQSFLSVLQAYPVGFSLFKKALVPNCYLVLVGLVVSLFSLLFNVIPETMRSYPTFVLYLILLMFARVYYRELFHHWKI